MAVPINIGTKAKPAGLTCWSANPAAQQRRPTTRCADVVVICYTLDRNEQLERLRERYARRVARAIRISNAVAGGGDFDNSQAL